jgi:hypothetical protein
MENIMIVAIITVMGAMLGTYIPYLLKVREEPETKFDVKYAYTLFFNLLLQALVLVPDTVPDLTYKVVLTAFMAGWGAQAIINKVVK